MSNAGANQSTVPSSRSLASNLITHPRIASHPRNNQFEINMMGSMIDYDFYIPDVAGDTTGLAFRVAYNALGHSTNDSMGLCVCVGSMLCSVVPAFRNSVEEALSGLGIRLRFVSLPSQAHENNIVVSDVPKLDRSSILAIFGYCILLLFNVVSKLFNSSAVRAGRSLHKKRIDKLRKNLGCLPRNYMPSIPFEQQIESSISTMLSTHALRDSIITFLMENVNNINPLIHNLCQYLRRELAFSGDMVVFSIMLVRLLKPHSSVLSDPRIKTEVDNLVETAVAIAAHSKPQYFNHLCSTSELSYLDVSRFKTLFAVAVELEKGGNGSDVHHFSENISGADRTTVNELVKFHLIVEELTELHISAITQN